jgi:hypothetical protein
MKHVKVCGAVAALVVIAIYLTGCAARPGGSSSSSGSTSSSASSYAAYPSGISQVSGLPYPAVSNVSKPTGTPGNMTVLNWAGFNAAVTYTFDDSQPSQVQHYNDLEAQGLHYTFFITCGWSNTSPNYVAVWSQAAQNGHELGNHTTYHPYANLSNSAVLNGAPSPFTNDLEEIDVDTAFITNVLGASNVWTMASPYGDTGWEPAAKQRFFMMRGVEWGEIVTNSSTNSIDCFNMPCYMAQGGETGQNLNALIGTDYTNSEWLIFLFHTLMPSSDNWYAPVDCTNVTESMNYTKGNGKIWIDSLYKVGAYWIAQQILNGTTPVTNGSTNTWTWTLPAHFPTGMYLRINVTGGTVKQGANVLTWDTHGFYEISLDAGTLTITP